VMVLVPCVVPKFVPVIVTGVPTVPEFGATLEIPGDIAGVVVGSFVTESLATPAHAARPIARKPISNIHCDTFRKLPRRFELLMGCVPTIRFLNW
jgi:hypothetical protein